MHMETFDGNIKDKRADETIDGSGSRNHSESNPEVSSKGIGRRNIGPEAQMDLITGSEISDKNNYSGSKSMAGSATSSSSSHSSSSSLDYDFFQMNTPNFSVSPASNPSSESAKSEVDDSPLVFNPIFQVFNETDDPEEEEEEGDMLPTESPPIQVMERPPVRIPSSVFERNGNALDWSIASNDSLFSIHLDTASFARNSTFTFDELGMSGEFSKTDELSLFSRTSSAVIEEDNDTSLKSVEVESLQATEASDEASNSEERSPSEDQPQDSHQTGDPNLSKSAVSSVSHGSRTSIQSFTFPILTQEERNRSVRTDSTQKQSHAPESDMSSYTAPTFCDAFHSKQLAPEVTSNSHHKQEPEVATSTPQSKKASQVTSKSTTKGCCYWFRCFYCPCIWNSCCTWISCSCRWKPCCKWKHCCCFTWCYKCCCCT